MFAKIRLDWIFLLYAEMATRWSFIISACRRMTVFSLMKHTQGAKINNHNKLGEVSMGISVSVNCPHEFLTFHAGVSHLEVANEIVARIGRLEFHIRYSDVTFPST